MVKKFWKAWIIVSEAEGGRRSFDAICRVKGSEDMRSKGHGVLGSVCIGSVRFEFRKAFKAQVRHRIEFGGAEGEGVSHFGLNSMSVEVGEGSIAVTRRPWVSGARYVPRRFEGRVCAFS